MDSKKTSLFLASPIFLLFFLFASSFSTDKEQNGGPQYASPETKSIIEKMIAAHGGMETWKNAPTISFDNIMYNNTANASQNPWWVSKVVIEQNSRRVYQDWPIHRAAMSYDGDKVWSENWTIANPPKFESHFFYYFLNLPWLTQDKNVQLGKVEEITVEGYPNPIYTIDMTFTEKPTVGKTVNDSFKLLIDSKSHLLAGYYYAMGYGHMLDLFGLPADAKVFGPVLRIHDSFTKVDGLIYPNRFHTMSADMKTTYGSHVIMNYSLSEEFDESRMQMSETAVIDQSSYLRNQNNHD